jgi:hypothetical protein
MTRSVTGIQAVWPTLGEAAHNCAAGPLFIKNLAKINIRI